MHRFERNVLNTLTSVTFVASREDQRSFAKCQVNPPCIFYGIEKASAIFFDKILTRHIYIVPFQIIQLRVNPCWSVALTSMSVHRVSTNAKNQSPTCPRFVTILKNAEHDAKHTIRVLFHTTRESRKRVCTIPGRP